MSKESTIVVGGGVIGLSIAYELSRRGNRVTIFDQEDGFGLATSHRAAGILPPANVETAVDPIDRLRGISHQMYPEWAARLKVESGIDPLFQRCGGWYLADTVGEAASMTGITQYWQSQDIQCEPIPLATIRLREPQLSISESLAGGWWVPDECQVDCPSLLRALTRACEAQGVVLESNCQIVDFDWNDNQVQIEFNGRSATADRAVISAGVWSGTIADRLKLQRSLVPIRGQVLMFKTSRPLLNSIANVGQRYVLCRPDGRTLVGSCEEEAGFEISTTESILATLRQFAIDWVPALADAEVADSWAGLRPLTFDGIPIIGRFPQSTNVYIAAGHFRSGIHLAPGTAIALVDHMLGNESEIDLGPFRVGKQHYTDLEPSSTPQ